ncbi:uncharacterized protein ARMOST_06967 [Armillaria ostoyae]|uniref:Uncharacterized protein n=1 Tax=Armillaria ostoyae TaxID=47428 RepID=A0A284R4H1_ARMOS|nr:uncharacterized protein ARMOST_06967 [Armillaria ostoyae]
MFLCGSGGLFRSGSSWNIAGPWGGIAYWFLPSREELIGGFVGNGHGGPPAGGASICCLFAGYQTWPAQFWSGLGAGGDADELDFDDEDQVKEWINHAKQAGRDLGMLNAKKVQLYQEHGCNSTSDSKELKTIEKVNTHTSKTSSIKVTGHPSNSTTVSEPKHTPTSCFHAQSQDAMSGMSEYFRSKAELEHKRIKMVEACLEHDKAKDKVSLARQLLKQKDSDLDWAVQEAANALLLKHLQG